MKKVIFGIGIPGSGKSTVLKKFAEKYGYDYISPDDIRQELTGNATDQSLNEEVWNTAYDLMQYSLENAGRSVVFDATQANSKYRKEFVARAKEYGAEKAQALFFDIPLETAIERNSRRDRIVPDEILTSMDKSLRDFPPNVEDNIDAIFKMDEKGKIVDIVKRTNHEGYGMSPEELEKI